MNWKYLVGGLSAVALGVVSSVVLASDADGIAQPSAKDVAVLQRLKERLPRTSVQKVNCQTVDGLCEVTAGTQLFYVDESARYLMIGRVYDMQTRQDLTAARLLEVNPDLLVGGAAGSKQEADASGAQRRGQNTSASPGPGIPKMLSLASLPEAGGIVWGNASSSKSVTIFTDFHCGYCKALASSLEQLDVRVIERPISILGSRQIANQVFCSRDRRRAVKAAYAGEPIADTRQCDTAPLDANERFARENGISGTPVLVRSDGAVIEGFRPKEFLATWINGAKS